MSTTTDQPYPHASPPGAPPSDLPPVEPPTAGFVVQLFVIPAVIVAVVVIVWLLFGKLAGGERDARDYVDAIRSENAYRRARAAFELASLIHNEPHLARDPHLLGELTILLDEELAKPDNPTLKQYLALTLGVFQTLDAQAGGRVVDPLARLADALGPDQPTEVRSAAAESLARQAARLEGTLDDPRAVEALERASRADSPELRQRAVYALGFFGGETARQVLRDRLDDGDRFVAYNAAFALGRQGDLAALDVYREMLTPEELAYAVRGEAEAERGSKIEAVELQALRSLQEAVRDGRTDLAKLLQPEIATATRSGLVSVRIEADALLNLLQRVDP